MSGISKADRMRLMRFVCAFAWADLKIQKEERAFVNKLVAQLDLDDAERAEVEEMLKRPPRPEDVDPARIPREHRTLFLEAVRAMIAADGAVALEEHEHYDLLETLLK